MAHRRSCAPYAIRILRRLLLLCLAPAGLLALPNAAGGQRQPNLVLIVADDLGYGDLSCYGHPRFRTPHIDRLAADGVRLTQFYAPAPFCAPSRASLLTGRYPFRCGLTTNPLPRQDPAGTARSDAVGLPPEETTLAEALAPKGYVSACLGKWHLGHRHRFRPLRQGFAEYLGVLYSNDMHPVELVDGDRVVEYPVVQATLTRRLTERAVAFLRANRERPFFLYFAQPMPHKPLAASEQFYRKSGAGLYGDAVAELDWSVGRVLDTLREVGLERDTMVVFTSDNGPWYGGSTGGLRGMKGQTWEGGLRVPCIVRLPGRIPAGSTSDTPGILPDLFPTLLAAAGAPRPASPLDGVDLLPALSRGRDPGERTLLFMAGNGMRAVRRGPWKWHGARPGPLRERDWRPGDPYTDPRAPDGVRILAPFEQYHPSSFPGLKAGDEVTDSGLFNLAADPGEQREVGDAHPEIRERMRRLFAAAEAEWKRGRQADR